MTCLFYACGMTMQGPLRWPHHWTRERRPRVVVENDDPWDRLRTAELLKRSGYSVGVCQGPDLLDGRRCPLAFGEPCPLVEDADALVCGLRLRLLECAAVLAGHGRHGVPVLVEVSDPHHDALPGTVPVPYDPSGRTLLEALASIAEPPG